MLEIVILSVVLMLCGILLYEAAKVLWNQLGEHRLKRECERIENKAFERDQKRAFEKLGLEWKKQSNCKPSRASGEPTVGLYALYK